MNHCAIPHYADATAGAPRAPTHSTATVQLHSGMCVDLLAPNLTELRLTDIATALARIPRFLGATLGDHAYSVAQHSVLVAQLLHDQTVHVQRAGLLHDAHEAFTGDIPTPVKSALGRHLVEALERRLRLPLFARFGLGPGLLDDARIHAADRLALATERHRLMAPSSWPWGRDLPAPRNATLIPWPEADAYSRFVAHAATLGIRP